MSDIRATSTIFTTLGLGAAVRAERRAFGLTQAGLAAAAGVPRQRISEIERGENVTALMLLRVLGALGKGLEIVDVRPNAGAWRSLFEGEDDAEDA
jgi:transcriptional regulator with XRE-family HTH domain